MNNKTKKLVFMSLLVAQSLVLYIIESYIPNPLSAIAPGAKIGLANIITLVALHIFGVVDTAIILVVRIIMASIFTGGASAFLYSITGGILSLLSMYICIKFKKLKLSTIGTSIVGGITHNIGQILVSSIIIQNINIFIYLPYLLIASIPTGIFIGMTAKFMCIRVKNYTQNIYS